MGDRTSPGSGKIQKGFESAQIAFWATGRTCRQAAKGTTSLESLAAAATGTVLTLQAVKSQTLLWTAPECPYRVGIAAAVLSEINLAAVEAYYSAPRGGVEIGGVFFGAVEGDLLRIQAHRPVTCQYLTGPSFKLSPNDRAGLSEVLKLVESDPELSHLKVAGWYHSHHRSEIFLSTEDLDVYREFFPEPWHISLVMRPAHLRPTRAGFFFRDRLGGVQAATPLQEFVLEPPDYGLTFLEPEVEIKKDPKPAERAPGSAAVEKDILPPAGSKGVARETVRDVHIIERPISRPTLKKTIPPEIEAAFREMAKTDVAAPAPVAPAKPKRETRKGSPKDGTSTTETPAKKSFQDWIKQGSRWIGLLEELKTGSERRTAKRESGDDLLAFFWDGDVPKGHRVRDISRRGAYVETEFSWTQGTFILLTLQIVRQSNVKSKAKTDPEDSIAVTAEVVRIVPGGMGLRFRLTDLEDVRSFLKFLLRWKPEAFPTPSGKRAVQS